MLLIVLSLLHNIGVVCYLWGHLEWSEYNFPYALHYNAVKVKPAIIEYLIYT